ncbi:hypothetical protein KR026_006716 [Drosophila bipectinata]|nr:hypothetical protein KR026_006716 [Drosophila bipectinata]
MDQMDQGSSGNLDPEDVLQWIDAQDVPQLEDESPPWNFYADEMQAKAVKLAVGCCDRRLVTLGNQTEVAKISNPDAPKKAAATQVTLGSQTEVAKKSNPDAPKKTASTQVSAMPKRLRRLPLKEPPTPMNLEKISWGSLLKKAILVGSLLHSAYAFGTACLRELGVLNLSIAAIKAGLGTQEPPCNPLPGTVWNQVAAKLCIHGYTN